MNKLKTYIIPHFVGFLLIILGWGLAIINVGIDKFSSTANIFNKVTVTGLIIIIIGAYLPEVWISIASRKK